MGSKLPAFVGQWGTIDTPAFYEGQVGWGNHLEPDVYVTDVNPNYPVGTKFIDGERVFVYGYVSTYEGTAARSGQGLCNIGEAEAVTTHATEHAIGSTVITIADTTPTAVLNRWAGGYFTPMSAPYGTQYRVLSNTVTDGTNFTITLERGLVTAVGASTGDCRLNQHPWADLCSTLHSGRYYVSFLGVPLVIPVAGRYMWVQTWGPATIIGGDEVPGGYAGCRMCQFNLDGSLVSTGWTSGGGTTYSQQYCGYIINSTTDGSSGYTASWFVYLQIAK